MRISLNLNFVFLSIFSLLLFGLLENGLSGQEKKEEKITYEDHVKPIFRAHCFSCHNQNKKEGDLDLTNYTSLMQGGGSGAVVEPGVVGDSYLFALVNHDEEPAMPPEQPKIPEEKISLLSKWIELGALENSASKAMVKKKKSFDFALTDPAVGKPSVVPMPALLDRQPIVHAKRASGVTAMATSPWAPLVAVAGQKQVLLYNSNSRELQGILPFPEGVVSVLKFSRNGSLLLAGGGRGGATGLVVVWNIKNGERIIQVGDELDTVLAADISSDQKLVALGGPQKMVRVYSTADNSLVYEIKKHTDWVTSLEFSPDGVLLCTGDRNGGVHVWEAFSGREYLTLKGHTRSITGISWRSDSNIVSTTSEDATIRLWEMNNGSQIRSWNAHGGGSLGVEFTRDGRLVSCGRDRYAKIWDQAGKQLFAFPAFPDIAMAVTHCDESNTAFAGDWTGEIRQFQAADGKQLATINSNPQPLEQRLAALQQSSQQYGAQVQQLTATAQKDKQIVTALTAQIAAAKKQMTDSQVLITKLAAKVAADQKTLQAGQQQMMSIKKRVADLGTVLPQLEKAKSHAVEASKKLPKDAELKKLADSFTAVLQAKQSELTIKNKEVVELNQKLMQLINVAKTDNANLKQYNANLNTAKQTLARVEPTLKPAMEKSKQSAAAMAKSVAQQNALKAQVASITQAIEFSRKYRELIAKKKSENEVLGQLEISHAEKVAEAKAAEQMMAGKMSEFKDSQSKVAAKDSEVKLLQSKMETLTQQMSEMQQKVVTMQILMQQTQASVPHLQSAKAKLAEAAKAAPGDQDLISAVKSMEALLQGQAKKVAEYQTGIQSNNDMAKKLSQNLAVAKQKKANDEKVLEELKVTQAAAQKELQQAQLLVSKLNSASQQAEGMVQKKEEEIKLLISEIAKLQGI